MPESDKTDYTEISIQYYGEDLLTWWSTVLDLIWKNVGLKPKEDRFLKILSQKYSCLKNSLTSPLSMFSAPLFMPKSLETKMDTRPGFGVSFLYGFFFLLLNKSQEERHCFCKASPMADEH